MSLRRCRGQSQPSQLGGRRRVPLGTYPGPERVSWVNPSGPEAKGSASVGPKAQPCRLLCFLMVSARDSPPRTVQMPSCSQVSRQGSMREECRQLPARSVLQRLGPELLFPQEDEGRWAGRTHGALPERPAEAWTERVTPRTLQREPRAADGHTGKDPGQGIVILADKCPHGP